jgi:hypothetical protein
MTSLDIINIKNSDIINLILRFDYLKEDSFVLLSGIICSIDIEEFKEDFKNNFYSKPFIKSDRYEFEFFNIDRTMVLNFSKSKLEYLKISSENIILMEIK